MHSQRQDPAGRLVEIIDAVRQTSSDKATSSVHEAVEAGYDVNAMSHFGAVRMLMHERAAPGALVLLWPCAAGSSQAYQIAACSVAGDVRPSCQDHALYNLNWCHTRRWTGAIAKPE